MDYEGLDKSTLEGLENEIEHIFSDKKIPYVIFPLEPQYQIYEQGNYVLVRLSVFQWISTLQQLKGMTKENLANAWGVTIGELLSMETQLKEETLHGFFGSLYLPVGFEMYEKIELWLKREKNEIVSEKKRKSLLNLKRGA